MESMGINGTLAALQALNFLLVAAYVALAVVALMRLRRADIPPTARAIWAALILVVPVLGAAAFLLAGPRSAT
jgi:hypothetical protein